MTRKIIKLFVLITIAIFIGNVLYYSKYRPNTALLRIDGIITDAKARQWIKQIRSIEESAQLKAALLLINSPGGSANASERLYLAIKELNRKKPVVVLVQDLAASGAYYAAAGASDIVAYPTSVVGSIGVLIESLNVSRLASRIGIEPFVIKSGPLKDAGNPLREPTPADRAMLQRVVNGLYEQFLNDVATSRHIPIKKLKPYADGSVFSAREAKKIGLIDTVGTEETAERILKEKAHLVHVRFERFEQEKGFLQSLLGERVLNLLNYLELAIKPVPQAIFHVGN